MTFSADIDKFVLKAQGLCDDVVSDAVKAVAFKVDQRSPVGNPDKWTAEFKEVGKRLGWYGDGYKGGHFRGNWQLGVGTRPTNELPGIDPDGSELGSRVYAQIPVDAAGKVYWLSNNVPYAMRLEMGYSKQAPQGIVGRTVTEWQGIVRKAAETAKARRA